MFARKLPSSMRRHRVNCRLTPTELDRLREASARVGHRPTTALRLFALAYLEQRFLLPANLEQLLLSCRQEIRRAGSNLNQLAAKANAAHRVTFGDLRRARRIAAEMEDNLEALRSALSSLAPVTCS
jgi:hypothetical protein